MSTIQLAVITGNEEEFIGRFLKSFSPHVDSVRIVRAIGNETPDRTLEIAAGMGAAVEEYYNATGNDWPHVDDFSAARNLSMQGDSDWILWADVDDILSESGAATLNAIRAGQDPGADVLVCPYVVGAQGETAQRIRLVKRSAFVRWENAVHEDIVLHVDAKTAACPALQIIHAPATNKHRSPDRNRRILEAIPTDKRTGREWFYLARECETQGSLPRAIDAAVVCTERSDLDTPEKYAAWLMIGRHIKDVEGAERPLMEAMRLDPQRPEAFGELATLHLRRGDKHKALAWAELLHRMERTSAAWNLDDSYNGWRGRDIYYAALANAGKVEDAKRKRTKDRRDFGTRITVCHPTIRPEAAIKVRELWLKRATRPDCVEYIFGIEPGTTGEILAYPHAFSEPVPEGHSSAVANYNAASEVSMGPIVIFAQDDVYPPFGWDEMIFEAMRPHLTKPRVLHVSDGFRTDNVMAIQCVNRAWLRRSNGLLLSPEYDGYYSDTELSWRAYRDGEVINGRHIKFYHDHPAFTGAASDENYMRQQNPEAWKRGRETFKRRNPDCTWV